MRARFQRQDRESAFVLQTAQEARKRWGAIPIDIDIVGRLRASWTSPEASPRDVPF